MNNPTLYAAVLANPADDAPRLAYAKWLKEKGDKDRADFIKVQCDRAAKDRFDPAQERLEKKEKSLLKKYEAKWRAELPEWAQVGARFRRGFVGVVGIELPEFVKRAKELVKLTPVEGIQLSVGGADSKGVQVLAQCPEVAQLTELSLWHNEVKNAGAKAIATSPLFANLKTLQLGVVGVTDPGVKALAASPHLANLTELNLSNNDIDADGLKALFASKWNLTTLILHGISLRGPAMTALANWDGLESVVELGIASCEIGPEEVKALAASKHLKSLRVLAIDNNPLTAAGISAIGGAPWLPQLVELHIQNSGLSDEVGRDILAWPPLPNLKRLISVNNQFTYETTMALIERYGNT